MYRHALLRIPPKYLFTWKKFHTKILILDSERQKRTYLIHHVNGNAVCSTTRRKPRPTQLMKNLMVQPMLWLNFNFIDLCVSVPWFLEALLGLATSWIMNWWVLPCTLMSCCNWRRFLYLGWFTHVPVFMSRLVRCTVLQAQRPMGGFEVTRSFSSCALKLLLVLALSSG